MWFLLSDYNDCQSVIQDWTRGSQTLALLCKIKCTQKDSKMIQTEELQPLTELDFFFSLAQLFILLTFCLPYYPRLHYSGKDFSVWPEMTTGHWLWSSWLLKITSPSHNGMETGSSCVRHPAGLQSTTLWSKYKPQSSFATRRPGFWSEGLCLAIQGGGYGKCFAIYPGIHNVYLPVLNIPIKTKVCLWNNWRCFSNCSILVCIITQQLLFHFLYSGSVLCSAAE